MVGSPPTPYIFDDRCRFDDVAEAIKSWYDEGHENREQAGAKGREFVLDPEIGMSTKNMSKNFIKDMDACFENFEKRERFTLFEV
jgi:dihydropteroate synthase